MCEIRTADANSKPHLIIAKPDAVVGQLKEPDDLVLNHPEFKDKLNVKNLVLPMIIMEVQYVNVYCPSNNVLSHTFEKLR